MRHTTLSTLGLYVVILTVMERELHCLERELHCLEIVWKRTHTALSWSSFTSLRNRYHKLILTAKKEYYSNQSRP